MDAVEVHVVSIFSLYDTSGDGFDLKIMMELVRDLLVLRDGCVEPKLALNVQGIAEQLGLQMLVANGVSMPQNHIRLEWFTHGTVSCNVFAHANVTHLAGGKLDSQLQRIDELKELVRLRQLRRQLPGTGVVDVWQREFQLDMRVWPPTGVCPGHTDSWLYCPLIWDALGFNELFPFPRPSEIKTRHIPQDSWGSWVQQYRQKFQECGVTADDLIINDCDMHPEAFHIRAQRQESLLCLLPNLAELICLYAIDIKQEMPPQPQPQPTPQPQPPAQPQPTPQPHLHLPPPLRHPRPPPQPPPGEGGGQVRRWRSDDEVTWRIDPLDKDHVLHPQFSLPYFYIEMKVDCPVLLGKKFCSPEEKMKWKVVDHEDGTGLTLWDDRISGECFAYRLLRVDDATTCRSPGEQMGRQNSWDAQIIQPSPLSRAASVPPSQLTLAQEMERVRTNAALRGLEVVEAGGEGDCFFRSLVTQLPAMLLNPDKHYRARQAVAMQIRHNRERYEAFVPTVSWTGQEIASFDAYVAHIAQPGHFIEGDIELHAAADYYNAWGGVGWVILVKFIEEFENEVKNNAA
ncbi:hypothetical protein CYMTET_5928 [Cymbomonas tetramitiformis]|uniref:OTU domain-containing protein n=1 Tax=Cymbomonas tetramitiformis TaxID=36881 RepID=A0AAE0GYG7_9CHLO|nr:hypothetical protein CYMTET_5928 [Cymbomonas tetramitiformis]